MPGLLDPNNTDLILVAEANLPELRLLMGGCWGPPAPQCPLDRGACVVLFPEGYLRRKEEQPLRRFGRGVWKILADRPDTPVFACWIDGNWGSYFSYKGGPPTKNKRFDFRRRIRIGVTGPLKVDPAILADHMATRTFLMRQVAAAREPLGLEPLDLRMLPEGDKE